MNMPNIHLPTLACCTLLAAATTAVAQEGRTRDTERERARTGLQDTQKQDMQKPMSFVALDTAKDSDLVRGRKLPPGTDPARESNGDAPKVGEVTDFVIDPQSGKIVFAAVEAEDRKVAVPFRALQWHQTGDDEGKWAVEPEFDLARAQTLDENHLDRLRIEPVEAGHRGIEGNGEKAREAAEEAREKAREAGEEAREKAREAAEEAREEGAIVTDPMLRTGSRYVLASKLSDLDIRSGENELGSIDNLYLEASKGCVAFVEVGTGGVLGIGEDERILPWQAVKYQPGMGEDQEPYLTLDGGEAALKSAPTMEGEAATQLRNADFRKRVYEAFGGEAPEWDAECREKSGSDGTRRR